MSATVTDDGRPSAADEDGARSSRWTARRAGALAMAPMLIGVLPFGLVVGDAAARSPEPVAGLLATWAFFGGSAHLAAMQLLADDAGAVVVIATVLVINARLLVYSAAMAPPWRAAPLGFRAFAAATLVEPTFALARARDGDGVDGETESPAGIDRTARDHHMGAAGLLVVGWTAAIVVGMTVGARLPDGLGLELAVPLSLIAMLAPELVARGRRAVVVAAVVAAVAGSALPLGTGLLVAVASAVVVGRIVARSEVAP